MTNGHHRGEEHSYGTLAGQDTGQKLAYEAASGDGLSVRPVSDPGQASVRRLHDTAVAVHVDRPVRLDLESDYMFGSRSDYDKNLYTNALVPEQWLT